MVVKELPDKCKFKIADMIEKYPDQSEALIEGLVRRREVFNLVGSAKSAKSWLGYSLLLSVATGRPWLGSYRTVRTKCLLVDNELSLTELPFRIRQVAAAMGLTLADYQEHLEVWALRGHLRSLEELEQDFLKIKSEGFGLILLDSAYRFAKEGEHENDNNSATNRYNTIDSFTQDTGAAIGLICHSSKGVHGSKRVTDVISGAGSQSRASDGHFVLLDHKTPGHMVLESVARSFPPTPPIGLKWEFPLWSRVDNLDATQLATSGKSLRDGARDESRLAQLRELLAEESSLTSQDITAATGWSREIAARLLGILQSQGDVSRSGKRPIQWSWTGQV